MEICKYCGHDELIQRESAKGTKFPMHIGLYCESCGKFQRWIKQPQNIETGEVASDAQQKYALDLLRRWKQTSGIMTKRQAGAIIQTFKE